MGKRERESPWRLLFDLCQSTLFLSAALHLLLVFTIPASPSCLQRPIPSFLFIFESILYGPYFITDGRQGSPFYKIKIKKKGKNLWTLVVFTSTVCFHPEGLESFHDHRHGSVDYDRSVEVDIWLMRFVLNAIYRDRGWRSGINFFPSSFPDVDELGCHSDAPE